MSPENYVEHVLASLSQRPSQDLQAHLNRLDYILKRVADVPSPEKEELLVELVLHGEERPESETAHASV